MSIHTLREDCGWHEPPLAPDANTMDRTCEWRGTCECGWAGEWHAESTHVAASLARKDYRDHIEGALGAGAYYNAPVACRNCGSEHVQGVLMGTPVYSNPCQRCGQSFLDPNNDAWHASDERARLWGL